MNKTYLHFIFLFIAVTVWNCNEVDSFGSELFDDGQQDVKALTFTNFDFEPVDLERLLMFLEDSSTMHYSRPETAILLGDYDDNLTGNAKSAWNGQFVNSVRREFSPLPIYVVDSVIMSISYDTAFGLLGDESSSFDIDVFEITEPLTSRRYFSNDELSFNPMPVGSLDDVTLMPKERFTVISGSDTSMLDPRLRIPLDVSFGERFIGLDSVTQDSAELFLESLNGLRVQASKVSGDGGFVRFVVPRGSTNINIYYRNRDSTDNLIYQLSPNRFVQGRVSGIYKNYNHFDYEINSDPEGRYIIHNMGARVPKLSINIDETFDTINVVDAFLEMYVDEAALPDDESFPTIDQFVPSEVSDDLLFFDEIPDANPWTSARGFLAGVNVNTIDTTDNNQPLRVFRVKFTRQLWEMIQDPGFSRDIYFVDPSMWVHPGRSIIHSETSTDYPMVIRLLYTTK